MADHDETPELDLLPEENAEVQRIMDAEGLSSEDAVKAYFDRVAEEDQKNNPYDAPLDLSDPSSGDDNDDTSQSSSSQPKTPVPDPEVDFLGFLKHPQRDYLVTESQILGTMTDQYLRDFHSAETPLKKVGAQLLLLTGEAAAAENRYRTPHKGSELSPAQKKKNRAVSGMPAITKPKALLEQQVCDVLLHRYDIVTLDFSQGSGEAKTGMLAIYQDSGPNEGLYTTDIAVLHRHIKELNAAASANFVESTLKTLQYLAPLMTKTVDKRWIPVQNGIFDHENKVLRDFTPELVFLNKAPVAYRADAQEPVLIEPDGREWTLSGWIDSLSEDEGVPALLWEVLSAVLRPGEQWDQALFLHSSKGNNGKGTFVRLCRNLIGKKATTSIPMDKFSKPFALGALSHAQAIITDENPVGAFSKDLGDFKSIVTGDDFTLERKYENPVSLSFQGTVIQCVNDFPKSKDKSASYARRQLFIPFRMWFGGDGVERKYIKQDYLGRAEVLEYALKEVLHMDHTEFSHPEACQALHAQFQRENNPVVDFWLDLEDQFVWDLLPMKFLYELFQGWFRQNHPSGVVINRNDFTTYLHEILAESEEWDFDEKRRRIKPGKMMDAPEPLILEYDLKTWMNPGVSSTADWMKKVRPVMKSLYSGPRRNGPLGLNAIGEPPDDQAGPGGGEASD